MTVLPARFPRRMVHLDLHTGPKVPDVRSRSGLPTFAQTYADAHVDSVTVFAKCHHELLDGPAMIVMTDGPGAR